MPKAQDPITESIDFYNRLKESLIVNKEINDAYRLNKEQCKSLVISAFSYVEHCFIEMLKQWLQSASKTTSLSRLVETKVFDRGFYQLFEFKEPHQRGFNRFLNTINISLESLKNIDQHWQSYAQAFITLGHKRNTLVHNNYVEQDLGQLTVEEISQMYQDSIQLIKIVKKCLMEQIPENKANNLGSLP